MASHQTVGEIRLCKTVSNGVRRALWVLTLWHAGRDLASPRVKGPRAPAPKGNQWASRRPAGRSQLLPHRRLAAESRQSRRVQSSRHQRLCRPVARPDRRATGRAEAARDVRHLLAERGRPGAQGRPDHRRLDARRRAGQCPAAPRRSGYGPPILPAKIVEDYDA